MFVLREVVSKIPFSFYWISMDVIHFVLAGGLRSDPRVCLVCLIAYALSRMPYSIPTSK